MPYPIPAVRRTLVALSQQQATPAQVMRALMHHDDWLVPAYVVGTVLGREELQLVLLGSEYRHPVGTLLLYTDVESAVHAYETGLELGPYGRGIDGVDILGALANFDTVVVNEGCPAERKAYLHGPGFNNAAVWADVVRFERVLADKQTPALERTRRIRRYDAYFVALHAANSAVVTVRCPGLTNAGLLFTSPDCVDAFIANHPDVPLRTEPTTGERITQVMSSLGVDGFVINACGPGVTQTVSLGELQIAVLAEMVTSEAAGASLEDVSGGE